MWQSESKTSVQGERTIEVSCKAVTYSALIPADITFRHTRNGWTFLIRINLLNPTDERELTRDFVLSFNNKEKSGELKTNSQSSGLAIYEIRNAYFSTNEVLEIITARSTLSFPSDYRGGARTLWPASRSESLARLVSGVR